VIDLLTAASDHSVAAARAVSVLEEFTRQATEAQGNDERPAKRRQLENGGGSTSRGQQTAVMQNNQGNTFKESICASTPAIAGDHFDFDSFWPEQWEGPDWDQLLSFLPDDPNDTVDYNLLDTMHSFVGGMQ
jgi:hypothetical protein